MLSMVTEVALQLVECIQQQMSATGVSFSSRLWLDKCVNPEDVQNAGVGLIVAALQLFQSLTSRATAASASTEGVDAFAFPML